VRDLSRPLQQCLEAIEKKRDLPEVLRRYPSDRAELVALLRLSVDLGGLEAPAADPAFRLRARNRMLAAAARQRQAHSRNPLRAWPRPAVRLVFAAGVLAALLVGGLTAAAASDSSLPGDPLYAVKLGAEQAQLTITLNAADRARLQLRFAGARLQEAQRLFAVGRTREAVWLVSQYEAAVAQFDRSVASLPLDNQSVEAISRDLAQRRARDDASLDAMAGSLTAGGDSQSAELVTRTHSHVDETFNGSQRDLQAHAEGAGQDTHPAKPVRGDH
jgi:Domain of unknown function (DUF5667)